MTAAETGREAPASPQCIPYRYWSRVHNLGDAITPHILRREFGLEAIAGGKKRPHLIGVGSIFALTTPPSVVWGAGVMDPEAPFNLAGPESVRAVRGKLSLAHLRQSGLAVADVPLGDPGILVDRLIDTAALAPGDEIVVIPHHSAVDSDVYDSVRDRPGFRLLDFRTTDIGPLEHIARAKMVISQSLHGLIFAEALGRPSVWISFSKDPHWDFKFQDWFSTTRNPQKRPVRLAELRAQGWEGVARQAELRDPDIDREALLASFPLELAGLGRPDLVPFDLCRRRSPHPIRIEASGGLAAPGQVFASPAELLPIFAELDRRITETVNRTFDGWAERQSYVLVFEGGALPGPEALQRAVRAMNRFSGINGFFLLGLDQRPPGLGETLASGDVFTKQIHYSPVLLMRANRALPEIDRFGTLFLNPHG